MADPACIASRGTGFRHSGIRATPAAAHTGVFPSHRWFQRQLNTRLSRERQGETARGRGSQEKAKGARSRREGLPRDSFARSLVARDALPRRYYRVSLPSRAMAGLGRTRARARKTNVGRERARIGRPSQDVAPWRRRPPPPPRGCRPPPTLIPKIHDTCERNRDATRTVMSCNYTNTV
jgi:hypothetical protein